MIVDSVCYHGNPEVAFESEISKKWLIDFIKIFTFSSESKTTKAVIYMARESKAWHW